MLVCGEVLIRFILLLDFEEDFIIPMVLDIEMDGLIDGIVLVTIMVII